MIWRKNGITPKALTPRGSVAPLTSKAGRVRCIGSAAMRRRLVPAVVMAFAASTPPISARAGQDRATFELTLTIVARQPAPRVIERSASTVSPGLPAYPVLNDQGVTRENSGSDIIVLETEF